VFKLVAFPVEDDDEHYEKNNDDGERDDKQRPEVVVGTALCRHTVLRTLAVVLPRQTHIASVIGCRTR